MSDTFADHAAGLSAVARLVKEAGNIWNLTHENPDGDGIGCALALHLALKSQGLRVRTLFPEALPQVYFSLPGANEAEYRRKLPSKLPDVILVNDTASFERLGPDFAPQLRQLRLAHAGEPGQQQAGAVLVNVDHHVSNEMFGDVNLVIPEAAATGEIIFALFGELGIEIPPGAVVDLYVALLTDTGRFCYPNTTSRTLSIAAKLVELGARPAAVAQSIYSQHTAGELRLLGRMLSEIVVRDELGYYYSFISQQMLKDCGCRLADTEGVIDVLRTLEKPPVCFLFKEQVDGVIKASIRTHARFDANAFASRFGGGGHPGAAGFTFEGTLEQAFAAVKRAMTEHARTEGGENKAV